MRPSPTSLSVEISDKTADRLVRLVSPDRLVRLVISSGESPHSDVSRAYARVRSERARVRCASEGVVGTHVFHNI